MKRFLEKRKTQEQSERISRMGIQQKLMFSYLAMVLFLMITGFLLFFGIMNNEARRKYIDSAQNNLNQLAYILDEQVNSVCLYADVLARNDDILFLVLSKQIKDRDIVQKALFDVFPFMTAVIAQNNQIEGIRILHSNPRLFNIHDTVYYETAIMDGAWEDKLRSLNTQSSYMRNWIFIEYESEGHVYASFTGLDRDKDIWYVYRSIYSTTLSTLEAVIEVRLDNSKLCAAISDFQTNENEFVVLIDKSGERIFPGVDEQPQWLSFPVSLEEMIYTVEHSGTRYIAIRQPVNSMNSYLVHFIPERNASMNNTSIIIYVLVMIALGILFYFASRVSSKLLLSQLLTLSNTMSRVEHGNMAAKVAIRSKDEIGEMADNFNNMLDRLKDAADTEKKLIYRHLSDQISPHFLCNALDMVCMSAKVKNQTEIAHAIELISRYFRTNLSAANGTVSIEEEFAYIQDYIEITNLIRDIPVTYDLIIEEGTENGKTPRFIIQPFVENALRHGFKSKTKHCHIKILARTYEGNLSLVIEDNGSGMSAEKLNAIRNIELDSKEDSLEIGITNSLRRMKIYYGDSFDFSVESYPGAGTRIELIIIQS
ncbi:MAG: histidine kinase [Bacillota bacterium]|nr:histidine kinase [Bacillota bacterium]